MPDKFIRKSFLATTKSCIFIGIIKKFTIWFSIIFLICTLMYILKIANEIKTNSYNILEQFNNEIPVTDVLTNSIKGKIIQFCNITNCSQISIIDKSSNIKFLFPNNEIHNNEGVFLEKNILASNSFLYSLTSKYLFLKFSSKESSLLIVIRLNKYYNFIAVILSSFILMLLTLYLTTQKVSRDISLLLTKEINNLNNAILQKHNKDFFANNITTKEIYVFYEYIIQAEKRIFNLLEKEKESKKLSTIGKTTAILAHDIRRPFSQIKNLLSIINDFKDNQAFINESINQINASIKQVEDMISDILDFSREVILELEPLSSRGLITLSLWNLSKIASEKDIRFNYLFNNKYKILADKTRLSRALTNIISNAIEAVVENGTIEICFYDTTLNNKKGIKIMISNNGPLIAENDLDKLFNAFFTKNKKNGTGLGLASAQKIIQLHNGTIEVINNYQNNTVEFILVLPASEDYETI